MSRKTLVLLIVACLGIFGTVTVVLHRSNHTSTPAGSATSTAKLPSVSTAAPYAYITADTFFLMRGNKVVARVPRVFDITGAYNNQVVWTQSGDYVAFYSDAISPSDNPKDLYLDAVSTHTGALTRIPCSTCQALAAADGNNIVATSDTPGKETLLKVDLSTSKSENVDLPSPMLSMQLLASAGGKVFGLGATSDPQFNDLLTLDKGTSVSMQYGPATDNYLLAAMSSKTMYSGGMAATASGTDPGICLSDYGVNIFATSMGNPNGLQLTPDTAVKALNVSNGGADITDLWWGLDGHLRATMQSWTCKAASNETDKMVLAKRASLWRLDGTHWVNEDPRAATMVRELDASTRIVLVIPNHIGVTGTVDPLHYRLGDLFIDQNGKRTLLTSGVLSISTPSP